MPGKTWLSRVCDAWKGMVEYLNTQRINGDELVYEKGISLDTVQRRWKLYMAIVKQYQARALSATGMDDEEMPPLLFKLEDLYNNWQSFTGKQISKKTGIAAKKQKDLDACDNLRQAGMGNLAANNEKEGEDTIDLDALDNDDNKPPGRKNINHHMLLVQQQWSKNTKNG
jgi:hypothetical protein